MTDAHSAERDLALHEWETEADGEVDIFAFEGGGFHNGPRCRRCGEGFCHHCHPECYTDTCPIPPDGGDDD